MTEYETKVAACPFCGGTPKLVQLIGAAFVECTKCGARGGGEWSHGDDASTNQAAIAKWNERGGFGHTRIALVNPALPAETFKLLERLRESEDRLERGDFGEVDRGALLLMKRKVLSVVVLRMQASELRDVASALIQAIDAQSHVLKP